MADLSRIVNIQTRSKGPAKEMAADQCLGQIQFGSETFSTRKVPSVTVSLGYRRWEEFDPTNGIGQDAAICRFDSDYVVGVVADGVSQSFYGDIAASLVSQHLIEILWNRRKKTLASEELGLFMKNLEPTVDDIVKQRSLSTDLDDITKDALEATRSSGSQTVFGAFVFDLPARTVTLYQSGDIDAVIHRGGVKPIVCQSKPSGRWSSAGKSKLNLEVHTFEGLSGVILHSDGLGKAWGVSPDDLTATEAHFLALAPRMSVEDDLSFVSVSLTPQAPLNTSIASDRPRGSSTRILSEKSLVVQEIPTILERSWDEHPELDHGRKGAKVPSDDKSAQNTTQFTRGHSENDDTKQVHFEVPRKVFTTKNEQLGTTPFFSSDFLRGFSSILTKAGWALTLIVVGIFVGFLVAVLLIDTVSDGGH